MTDADDVEEFTAFVAGAGGRLLRLAYLLTGDRYAAEDVLQGALERTYRRWSRLRRADGIEAYVRRAIVNAATDRHRRRREEPLADTDLAAPRDPEDIERRDELIRAVMTLSVGQRSVLVLRYFEDLTEAQTADALGCSVGTVKSQNARALARLRDLLPSRNS